MNSTYEQDQILIELAELYLRTKRLQADSDYWRNAYFKLKEANEIEAKAVKGEEEPKSDTTF